MTAVQGAGDDPIDILLVEANPGNVRLFAESFRDAQITNHVYDVSDGAAALDFVHRCGEYADAPRPDIILLDPQLPGTDGIDILSDLADEPAVSDIPVVILTSSGTEENIVKSHGLEADTYIQKPVEVDKFVDFVQSVEDFWLTIVRRPAGNE